MWRSVPQRRFDLLRPDLVLLGHAVQQNPQPVFAGPELLEAVDEPMRVPDRGHVGVGDEVDGVGREHGHVGGRAR